MESLLTIAIAFAIIAISVIPYYRRQRRKETDAKNRMREPAVVRVSETPMAVDAVAEPEPIEADTSIMDATLLALFRKRAPERLVTLRDARARGDHEKVARVVHTLKPQPGCERRPDQEILVATRHQRVEHRGQRFVEAIARSTFADGKPQPLDQRRCRFAAR